MLPESIIDSIFNTAVKFVVEKMTARVGNDFQEAVHRCFDSLVHWLAGVLVGVGCKEVWDFPDVTSSTHDGVSNHVVEVVARHWPFTDNVTAINAESSCRHTNGIHLFGPYLVLLALWIRQPCPIHLSSSHLLVPFQHRSLSFRLQVLS